MEVNGERGFVEEDVCMFGCICEGYLRMCVGGYVESEVWGESGFVNVDVSEGELWMCGGGGFVNVSEGDWCLCVY